MPYTIEAELCSACGSCADQCPSGAIAVAGGGAHYVVDPEKCVDCGACESSCPSSAIRPGN